MDQRMKEVIKNKSLSPYKGNKIRPNRTRNKGQGTPADRAGVGVPKRYGCHELFLCSGRIAQALLLGCLAMGT